MKNIWKEKHDKLKETSEENLKELEKKLDELKEIETKNQDKIAELESKIVDLNKELNDLSTKNSDLAIEIRGKKQEIRKLKKEVEDLKNEKKELEKKRKELSKLRQKIIESEKKEKEYQEEIKKLEQEIANAKNDKEKQELEKQLAQKKEELTRVKKNLSDSLEQMEGLRKTIKELLQNEPDGSEEVIEGLETQLAEAKEESRKLDEQIISLNSQMENLQEELVEKKQSIQKKQQTIANLNKEIESLKKQISELLKNSQPNQEPLAGEIIDCHLGIESKKNEISELENQLVTKEEEIKKASENTSLLEKLNKEKADLEAQLLEKEKELVELKKTNEELEKQLRTNCQKLRDKVTEKTKELEDKKVKLGSGMELAKEIIFKGENLEEFVNSLCNIQDEITRLELQSENIEGIQKSINSIKAEAELPSGLSEVKSKLEESDWRSKQSYDYGKIHPKGFLKDFDDRKTTELPTKLIELSKIKENDKLEQLKADKVGSGIEENYAILSYSWGAPPWDRFREDSESSNLYGGSEKSFRKAIGACKKLNVNHLWIDCLCINQKDEKELARELMKLRQYYNNAKVTLIPIQAELDKSISLDSLYSESSGKVDTGKIFDTTLSIIERITKSKWFLRMWTFQEGMLSPQTVFMFDDHLIDGRFLAMVWSIKQGPETNLPQLTKKKDDLRNFFEKYTDRVATPLGWVYYEHGYSSEKKIYLGLCQLLKSIEKREGFMLADCIYSALGLLPYGDKVEQNYKEEPDEILTKVMEVAVRNGYGEPLSWYGEGNNEKPELLGLCWAPKIEKDGKVNIKTSIERVAEDDIRCEPDSINFTKNGIEINGSNYNILDAKDIVGNGDVCSRKLLVENSSENKWVRVQGTCKSLEKITIGNNGKSDIMLLVPSKSQWRNNPPVALLATSYNEEIYHRVDLVRILEGSRHLTNPEVKLTVGGVGLVDSNELENQVMVEAQIATPPVYKKW